MSDLDDHTLGELAQLAGSTLEDSERAPLQARIEASPELAAAFDRQLTALSALRAVSGLEAPLALRTRLEEQRTKPTGRIRRRRAAIFSGVAGIAAAIALIAVIALPPGTGGPSISEAAGLSSLPATDTSVAIDPSNERLLDAEQSGVPFPNLVAGDFGWRQTGERTDELDGRDTTTVFYERDGKRIGYTIVSGEAIDPPEGSKAEEVNDVSLHSSADGSKQIVTWLREGKTCVLSGEGVSTAELLTLASWKGEGNVPF